MPLGFGQHLHAPHRRGRRRLQRVDQILQRRAHERADTLAPQRTSAPAPSARTRHQDRPPTTSADSWCAPRRRAVRSPPRPASAVSAGGAVAIVQQRREQRRRRAHGAAALRQRQRGMLVAHQLPPADAWVWRTHCLDARIANRDAHRQRVDEQAQRPSAPSPPCMRPNSTVPNTTSSRPDARATTCAQATWNRLAALTPRAPRPRAQPPARARHRSATALRRSASRRPARRASPNGAVGSSTSPSMLAEERLVLRPRSPPAAPAPRSCGTAAARRKLAGLTQQMGRTSPHQISSVVWSSTRWWTAAAAASARWPHRAR